MDGLDCGEVDRLEDEIRILREAVGREFIACTTVVLFDCPPLTAS
jgi:hypothetical protein